MEFYESISAHYDEIFPASREAISFLDRRAGTHGRILDIACGTGGHALGLSDLGHRVTGIDLDRTMIERAKEKAEARDVQFYAGDMLGLGQVLRPYKKSGPVNFDLVYCIGNSIVHLSSHGEIARVLKDVSGLLDTGGHLVVQIVNYDRILRERIMELPSLQSKTSGLLFKRAYDFKPGDGHVMFTTELIVKESGEEKRIRNSIPLLILTSDALKKLAAEAGFGEIALFGSFDGSAYGDESFALILSASKKSSR
ncbi:MAG TPA: class I SAM-dependent methyltransferase [Spirochaetia bacterium]|nr:class I SAM-dependent methyltransferase [Spirochaetia bacterium]